MPLKRCYGCVVFSVRAVPRAPGGTIPAIALPRVGPARQARTFFIWMTLTKCSGTWDSRSLLSLIFRTTSSTALMS